MEDVNPRVNPPGTRMDMVSGSSGWADAAVILPYTLWKQSGDVSFIYDNYELMQGWMNYIIHICQDKSMFCLPDGHPLSTVYQTHRLKDLPMEPLYSGNGCSLGGMVRSPVSGTAGRGSGRKNRLNQSKRLRAPMFIIP